MLVHPLITLLVQLLKLLQYKVSAAGHLTLQGHFSLMNLLLHPKLLPVLMFAQQFRQVLPLNGYREFLVHMQCYRICSLEKD